MDDQQLQELLDLLHTIENQILIARILIELQRFELLPTPLENIYENSQTIVDNYCIKER